MLTMEDKKSANYLAALSYGLVGITRPEGILYGLLWYLFTLKLKDNYKLLIRYEILRITILLFPFIIYQIFRLDYFNTFFPNTALAKPPGKFGDNMLGLLYLYPWIKSLGGLIIILPLLLLPIRITKQYRLLLKTCIGPIVAALNFVVYAQGDWMPFGRFIVPIWPMVVMIVVIWIHSLFESLKELQFLKYAKLAKFIVAVTLMLLSLATWRPTIQLYIKNEGMNMLMRGVDQIAVGKWLSKNIKPGVTVATGRLGGISYAAPNLIFWDINGLTDREQAKFLAQRGPGGFEKSPVISRSPNIIAAIVPPNGYGQKYLQWLEKNYAHIHSFPQGNYGWLDIWASKDLSDIMIHPKISN
jgi:hypothetical protein